MAQRLSCSEPSQTGCQASQSAAHWHFLRCPPGCAHASNLNLLLTPPRAIMMRCEPALCSSMTASSPPSLCYAHLPSLGTVPVPLPVAVEMASSRHQPSDSPLPRCAPPPEAYEFSDRPAGQAPGRPRPLRLRLRAHSHNFTLLSLALSL